MADSDNAQEAPLAEPAKKSRGCLFYGCLFTSIACVLGLLLVVGAGVGGYYWAKGQVAAYTEEEPAEIPVIEVPPEDLAEIQGRIEAAQQALDLGADESKAEGEGVDEAAANDDDHSFELTAREINALIAANENLRGKVYVRIEDGIVSGDLSIPGDLLPMGLGKGRYFNASVSFDVSYQNGDLVVTLTDATVKGKPLPAEFMEPLKTKNLAKDLDDEADMREALARIEDIEVLEDRIRLRLRKPEPGEAANEKEEASPPPTGAEAP